MRVGLGTTRFSFDDRFSVEFLWEQCRYGLLPLSQDEEYTWVTTG